MINCCVILNTIKKHVSRKDVCIDLTLLKILKIILNIKEDLLLFRGI